MRLSRNFSLLEFTRSQIASRQSILNVPPSWAIENLRRLVADVLQPVRDHFGVPVSVSSGYRSAAVERALKGKPESWEPTGQHPRGEAADFEVVGHSNLSVAEWIADHLAFDKLILEFYQPGDPRSGWVHCSYRAPNRGEVFRAVKRGNRVQYLPGLAPR